MKCSVLLEIETFQWYPGDFAFHPRAEYPVYIRKRSECINHVFMRNRNHPLICCHFTKCSPGFFSFQKWKFKLKHFLWKANAKQIAFYYGVKSCVGNSECRIFSWSPDT